MGRGTHSAVNIRMPATVLNAVDAAADTAHLDRSAYCRELITAAVASGLTLTELIDVITTAQARVPALLPAPEAAPPARLGRRRMVTGRCLHPVHRVLRYPTRDVCGACNHTLRTR